MRLNVELKKDIHWVGAIDWSVRDFHGYSTKKGTTYNAFLVMDDKITLFDTVKKPFARDLLHCIHKVVDPAKIDYIVVNHVEPDHSGALPELVDVIKPEKIFCSTRGKKALLEHYHHPEWPYEVVQTGQQLSLGKRTVHFLETRMVHWPDSMFSYLAEDAILIASDGFGQHWATTERFNDQVNQAELLQHAAKYFANILLPYSGLISKLVADVSKMNLKIDMICPDHGLIWRDNPLQIVSLYDRWAKQVPTRKAVIIYDSMWNSTQTMAKAILDGLVSEGVDAKLMDLKADHRSDIMTEILDAAAIIVGSPTLNNNMLPTMADMLCYMRGLRPANKVGAAFGSYGWSGESVRLMTKSLEETKVKIVHPGVSVQYVPTHDTLKQCVELGQTVAKAVKSGG